MYIFAFNICTYILKFVETIRVYKCEHYNKDIFRDTQIKWNNNIYYKSKSWTRN